MKKAIAGFLSSVYHFLLLVSQGSYRFFSFRVKKVNARVISVGNITWGGTGKTPMVIWLAKRLSQSGKRVAVLTRGYGKDEVAELRKNLPEVPVLVGRNRLRSAREAVRKHKAEIILLDDGFQHIRLHRDLDIVNINSTLPFGPGGLLPLGTLREPLEHLSRAHIFVLTKVNIGSKNLHWIRQRLQMIKPEALIFESVHRPTRLADFKRNRYLPLESLKGKKISVISGIGDPFSFEKSLEQRGAEILYAGRFEDHHEYRRSELADFAKKSRELGIREIVTTEKDFYRIEPFLKGRKSQDFNGIDILVLQIEFEMSDEEDFIRRCVNS